MSSDVADAFFRKNRIPVIGEEIMCGDKKYKLIERLGVGGYGSVFIGVNGNRRHAVKIEKYDVKTLHLEVEVFRAINASKPKHFCEMFASGRRKPEYAYIVMSLLDKDIYRLRQERPNRKFSFSTAIRIGAQSLKAIDELHQIGWISRDIKPSNFAPGLRENDQHKTIIIYDFGLARKHLDEKKRPVASRGEVGWRGTGRWAPLAAHKRQDLARKDDLESWMYMLVEATHGGVPWRMLDDRSALMKAKIHARTPEGRRQLFFDCPMVFNKILEAIDMMKYETTPDYELFHKMIKTLMTEKNVKDSDRFDWEECAPSTDVTTAVSLSAKEIRADAEDQDAKEVTEIDDDKP